MRELVIQEIIRTIFPNGINTVPGRFEDRRYGPVINQMWLMTHPGESHAPKKLTYDRANARPAQDFVNSFDWNLLSDEQLLAVYGTAQRRFMMQM